MLANLYTFGTIKLSIKNLPTLRGFAFKMFFLAVVIDFLVFAGLKRWLEMLEAHSSPLFKCLRIVKFFDLASSIFQYLCISFITIFYHRSFVIFLLVLIPYITIILGLLQEKRIIFQK